MNQQAKTSLTDALMGLALILALCVPSISGASPGKAKGPFSQRALEVIESRGADKVDLIVTYRSKADAPTLRPLRVRAQASAAISASSTATPSASRPERPRS